MKTLWQHSERGNISELGADILQNWHHIRTQAADTTSYTQSHVETSR